MVPKATAMYEKGLYLSSVETPNETLPMSVSRSRGEMAKKPPPIPNSPSVRVIDRSSYRNSILQGSLSLDQCREYYGGTRRIR